MLLLFHHFATKEEEGEGEGRGRRRRRGGGEEEEEGDEEEVVVVVWPGVIGACAGPTISSSARPAVAKEEELHAMMVIEVSLLVHPLEVSVWLASLFDMIAAANLYVYGVGGVCVGVIVFVGYM